MKLVVKLEHLPQLAFQACQQAQDQVVCLVIHQQHLVQHLLLVRKLRLGLEQLVWIQIKPVRIYLCAYFSLWGSFLDKKCRRFRNVVDNIPYIRKVSNQQPFPLSYIAIRLFLWWKYSGWRNQGITFEKNRERGTVDFYHKISSPPTHICLGDLQTVLFSYMKIFFHYSVFRKPV